jgi:uncharacterized protein YabN with tetrapyrrole methylase and pyrophosphatase domain
VSGEKEVFARLIRLARTLRGDGGCPWDRAQDPASLSKYVLSEAGELHEAACAGDTDHVREEIGDALFTLLSMAVLAEENGDFSLTDVLEEVEAKIVRRHPHVFGDASAETVEEACTHWKEVKKSEKRRTRKRNGPK